MLETWLATSKNPWVAFWHSPSQHIEKMVHKEWSNSRGCVQGSFHLKINEFNFILLYFLIINFPCRWTELQFRTLCTGAPCSTCLPVQDCHHCCWHAALLGQWAAPQGSLRRWHQDQRGPGPCHGAFHPHSSVKGQRVAWARCKS
jgi:hypothetical protein